MATKKVLAAKKAYNMMVAESIETAKYIHPLIVVCGAAQRPSTHTLFHDGLMTSYADLPKTIYDLGLRVDPNVIPAPFAVIKKEYCHLTSTEAGHSAREAIKIVLQRLKLTPQNAPTTEMEYSFGERPYLGQTTDTKVIRRWDMVVKGNMRDTNEPVVLLVEAKNLGNFPPKGSMTEEEYAKILSDPSNASNGGSMELKFWAEYMASVHTLGGLHRENKVLPNISYSQILITLFDSITRQACLEPEEHNELTETMVKVIDNGKTVY